MTIVGAGHVPQLDTPAEVAAVILTNPHRASVTSTARGTGSKRARSSRQSAWSDQARWRLTRSVATVTPGTRWTDASA